MRAALVIAILYLNGCSCFNPFSKWGFDTACFHQTCYNQDGKEVPCP